MVFFFTIVSLVMKRNFEKLHLDWISLLFYVAKLTYSTYNRLSFVFLLIEFGAYTVAVLPSGMDHGDLCILSSRTSYLLVSCFLVH